MENKHDRLRQQAQLSVQQQSVAVAGCRWRPHYHFAPPAYWMNDPNGFCWFRGEYHLFYQHHPYSAEWGSMYWGHARSRDLVHWEYLPIALAPGEPYDADGCFSGSALVQGDRLILMYTGHVWTGENRDTDLCQTQCLAVSDDGVTFAKWPGNPVIPHPPGGDIHPNHFRDPKVWKHRDCYYAVIGSKTADERGQALLYRSPDLYRWEFVNIMARAEGNEGYMWECPDFFHLDDHDVLVLSPQGMSPEGHRYHNLHQSGYFLGSLDYERGIFTRGAFQLLDHGFDFYAPQTLIDGQGRRILIAWMDMWESPMPTQANGWAGAMTLPRLLTIRDGRMFCEPVPELRQLRTEEVCHRDVTVEGTVTLPGIAGDVAELWLEADLREATRFGIKLRADERSGQETVLTCRKQEQLLELDRSRSGAGVGGVRRAPVKLADNRIRLHLFLDKSSVEVFVNDGELVMTARLYPGEESVGISFESDGPVRLSEVRKWTLRRKDKAR